MNMIKDTFLTNFEWTQVGERHYFWYIPEDRLLATIFMQDSGSAKLYYINDNTSRKPDDLGVFRSLDRAKQHTAFLFLNVEGYRAMYGSLPELYNKE